MISLFFATAFALIQAALSQGQDPLQDAAARGPGPGPGPGSGPFAFPNSTSNGSVDVFGVLSHSKPINVPFREDHPQKPVGVRQRGPLQTNKFYANFFANRQDNATWTHPYSVWWSNDTAKQGHGLSVSHTDRSQFIYGPGNPVQSFQDPLFRQAVALSAQELQNGTVLTTDGLTAFSVNVHLAPNKRAKPVISFPLVQGMAFVTGVYRSARVLIQSQSGFVGVQSIPVYPDGLGAAVYGWTVQLGDGTDWLIYMTPSGGFERPNMTMVKNGTLAGPRNFSGTVQVAKNPLEEHGMRVFNRAAGAYPVSATISGSVSGRTGTYTLSWKKAGLQYRPLLIFALPHHVKSFDQRTSEGITNVTLASTTKGIATAVFAESFTMVERELPTDIGLDPWSPRLGSVGSKKAPGGTVSRAAKAAIVAAGKSELAEDIIKLTNLTSKYYAGIAFSTYARALYAVNDIAEVTNYTAGALRKLEAAFDRYVRNLEPNPLFYDNVWKGLVSSASYNNSDPLEDFGNTFYNDHNFHYGYYVYTAAIIAHFDPSWLTRNGSVNRIWVDNLIRDWSNPSTDDPYFPFSRSFDWFHGHSWARGVLEAPDGKDQESSAEDAFSTYAIKMWGRATGDARTEARGNLQLAVNARSLQSYFLMADDNDVQPRDFIGNRAVGILFDRKANHTTYFGDQTTFIEGIHMLPIVPSSAYVRRAPFVRQEWDQYFAGNRTGNLTGGGFVGHVYVNLAIADQAGAEESYRFMRAQRANSSYLDGQSLAWNLAYTAALGGSLANSTAPRLAKARFV